MPSWVWKIPETHYDDVQKGLERKEWPHKFAILVLVFLKHTMKMCKKTWKEKDDLMSLEDF